MYASDGSAGAMEPAAAMTGLQCTYRQLATMADIFTCNLSML